MATFAEIVQEVMDKLNYSSPEAQTRVGNAVNSRYKRATSGVGLNIIRRATVQQAVSIGVSTVTFSGIEKITNVVNRSVTPYRVLDSFTMEELRALQPFASSEPHKYAVQAMGASSVTILMDCTPQTAFTLYCDGYVNATSLSGSQIPAFAEDFHDILTHGALADEYRKMEKVALMQDAEKAYEQRISDLRLFIAKDGYLDMYPGKTQEKRTVGMSGASGSGVNGAASYTQTGLITFDRSTAGLGLRYPFSVISGSDKVANLDADKLDGADWNTSWSLTDITTNDVSSTAHGLAPKSLADATKFLNSAATPGYALVKDSDLSTSDVTTNDVTTAKHGFTPKAPNDTAKFLRGDATWATLASTLDTVITSTSTGVLNDFAPGLSGHTLLLMNNASLARISGFAGGVSGQRLVVVSTNAQIQFIHQGSTSTTAADRLICFSTSTEMALAAACGAAAFEYDGTVSRWRMIWHEQGDWISPAYTDTDYTGPGGDADWVVEGIGTDVITYQYYQKGRSVQFMLYVQNSTVANAPATLRLLMPFTAAAKSRTVIIAANSTSIPGVAENLAGDTKTYFYKDLVSTAWANGTNNVGIVANWFTSVQ